MKLIWFVLAAGIYTCSIQGTETPLTIQADLVQYRGKSIILNGDVELEHRLGKISAQLVELNTPAGESKVRLGTLDLTNQVRLSLNEGGILECGIARVDFRTMQGNFRGETKEEDVIYTENYRDKAKGSGRTPLIFKSKQMAVHFAQAGVTEKDNSKWLISKILADGLVSIDYNHDFTAQSDTATYEKEGESNSSAIGGLITLKTLGPERLCTVKNRHGDLINATTICIDTNAKKARFVYAEGVLNGGLSKGVLEKIEFSADILLWDMENNLLVLKDNVILNQKGLGTLTNDNEIRLSQKNNKLYTVESNGKTDVVIKEEQKNIEHHLTCYGKVKVNHTSLEMLMESPQGQEGKIVEGQQVIFEDNLGVIYADKVTLKYALDNKSVVPKILFLEGNVKMMNTYASEDPSSPLVQYALADKVEYYPLNKEVVFSSNRNLKRVLFYDKTNDLQISAPMLKIKRDQATKKDLIKGTGDVRFSFIENEFEQLRNRFSNFKEKRLHGSK